jgi:hypothetical protein
MSLTKGNNLIISLSVICLLIASSTLIFPGMMDNFMTGLASIASFSVGVSVTHAELNLSSINQLDTVIVNGTDVSIAVPVIYYGIAVMNLSIDMPESFEDGFGWYVNESGTIKNVTQNGTILTWLADKTVSPTTLHFEVPPPMITSDIIYTGDSYYERTFVVSSNFHFINVSANLSVSSNYQDYILYLIENSTLVDKSTEYNFQVANSIASFYGFNLSNINKTFRIQAAPNATIVERIVNTGGGGGGSGGGTPLLNYTPSQQFFVEPNYISISTYSRGFLDSYILIYNLRGEERIFNITCTKNVITDMPATITVPPKGSTRVPVLMNTDRFAAGKYKDYITVRTSDKEEKVTVEVELLEAQEAPEESRAPATEQPTILPGEEQGQLMPGKGGTTAPITQPDLLKVAIISVLGLGVMFLIVFVHMRTRSKTVFFGRK